MNIFHIFPYSVRLSGGHSNAIRGLINCQRAAGLSAFGISPLPTDATPDAADAGEWIHEIPFDNPAAIFARIRDLAGDGPAILHLHAIDRFSTQLAADAGKHGFKVVITSHGQLNCRSLIHGIQKAVYLAAFRSPLRHAAGIHVLTLRERKRLRLMIPWFRGHIATIPHVVEAPAATAPASSGNPIALTILHLGRLDVNHKGLDILLRAFAKSGLNQARMVLAGPDWNQGRATLEAEAAALGCLDRVEFPGAIYGEAKDRLLRSADLFVACSRWEAFNLSLVEAMARGTPVLVSDRLNLAPALADDDAAEVAGCSVKAMSKALRRLGEDPARRQHLAVQARQWAEMNTSGPAVGCQFAEFYRRLAPASH